MANACLRKALSGAEDMKKCRTVVSHDSCPMGLIKHSAKRHFILNLQLSAFSCWASISTYLLFSQSRPSYAVIETPRAANPPPRWMNTQLHLLFRPSFWYRALKISLLPSKIFFSITTSFFGIVADASAMPHQCSITASASFPAETFQDAFSHRVDNNYNCNFPYSSVKKGFVWICLAGWRILSILHNCPALGDSCHPANANITRRFYQQWRVGVFQDHWLKRSISIAVFPT